MKRKASAIWTGGLKDGRGTISTESGVLSDTQYSFSTRFEDGIGEIGIIAPVSHPFCGHCSRIRITSDGKIRTCLFSVWDHDLHELMRRGASDEKLSEFIVGVVQKKEERHHIGEPGFVPASRTMVHIGG